MPHAILDTTLYHHTPSLAHRNLKRVAVTHLADYITTNKMLAPTEKDPNYPLDHSSLEVLHITEDDLREFESGISGDAYSSEHL